MSRLASATLIAASLLVGTPALADVLIGVAAPLSGNNAVLGEQIRRGAQRAIDDINTTGGIRGERLALRAADDGCDAKKAVDVATSFVSDGVKFVAGHYCSGASIPASRIYEAGSILQISPASTNPKLTEQGLWNVFRIVPRDDAQAVAAASMIAGRFASQKIALVNDQSPSSRALADALRAALKSKSIALALDESFKPGGKDYASLAQKIASAGTAVVYFAGAYPEAAIVARALRDAGSNAQIIASDALVTDDFWNLAKEAAEGTIMTFAADPQTFAEARSVIDEFRADDYVPEGYTLYAYAAVQTMVKAAEATGALDSRRMADWLHAGNVVKTVVGDVSFDAKGDLRNPRIAWLRWVGGKYVQIDPATLQPLD